MRHVPRLFSKLVLASTLLVAITACNSESKKSDNLSSETLGAEGSGEETEARDSQGSVALDYPHLYCESIPKIQLRTEIDYQVSYFCKDNAPTELMLEFRKAALEQEPGVIELTFLESKHIEEEDYSEFLVAWSFHVAIRPFEVKERPIYSYVSQPYDSDDITLAASSERQGDDTLDSGLHLWSVNISYDLTVKGTETRFLESQRNTQYNLYQVLSGNEEMGLGVEHLTDTNNPDFSASKMTNISFNDGDGFNDGQGGTIVITALHFKINNHGFPQTAERSIREIAQHTANVMYEGLKQ